MIPQDADGKYPWEVVPDNMRYALQVTVVLSDGITIEEVFEPDCQEQLPGCWVWSSSHDVYKRCRGKWIERGIEDGDVFHPPHAIVRIETNEMPLDVGIDR